MTWLRYGLSLLAAAPLVGSIAGILLYVELAADFIVMYIDVYRPFGLGTDLEDHWQRAVIVASVLVPSVVAIILAASTFMATLLGAIWAPSPPPGFATVDILSGDAHRRAMFDEPVAALEAIASYPLGTSDTFRISHGASYFAFFDRLGRVTTRIGTVPFAGAPQGLHGAHGHDRARKDTFAPLDSASRAEAEASAGVAPELGLRVVALASGILRTVSWRLDGPPMRCWYMCDLKVHPAYRKRRIPLALFGAGWRDQYAECSAGYFISMNSKGPNRMARLAERTALLGVKTQQLNIFSIPAEEVTEALMSTLAAMRAGGERSRVCFVTLAGVKDLVLGSTGKPMPLVHVHWGDEPPASQRVASARAPVGHTVMFCAPSDDALDRAIRGTHELSPAMTATIVSHGMSESDWSFVLTSEI